MFKYKYSVVWLLSLVLLLIACAEDIPSHSVTFKITDSTGVPVSANNPIEGIEVSAYAKSTEKQPKDGATEGTTNSDGKVTFILGEFLHYVNMFPEDYIGANVYFTVETLDLDFSDHPIVLAERYNHCSDVLGITDEGESWLRVYKTDANFSVDDTLTITPVNHQNEVNGGEDIAETPVVPEAGTISNIDYIDIYLGTTPADDTLGHKHTSLLFEADGSDSLEYDVNLNGKTVRVSASNCGHSYSVAYF